VHFIVLYSTFEVLYCTLHDKKGGIMGLMTTAEVAERLNISQRTVLRYCADGRLPFIKVGRDFRFEWEKVILALGLRGCE
jgi:excisionase family DNA binding protein